MTSVMSIDLIRPINGAPVIPWSDENTIGLSGNPPGQHVLLPHCMTMISDIIHNLNQIIAKLTR